MSNPYKVVIGFAGSRDLLTILVSEQNAEVIGNTVVNQSAGYSIALLDWNTGEDNGQHFIINGRNVDYLTMEEYQIRS